MAIHYDAAHPKSRRPSPAGSTPMGAMAASPQEQASEREGKADAAAAISRSARSVDGAPPGPPSVIDSVPDHTLIRCVGRGAYGAVWLARNVMGSYRAVKVVHQEGFGRDRSFHREFEGLLNFEPISRSHPNLMQILHVGRHDHCFYYVTELADDASREGEPGKGAVGTGKPGAETESTTGGDAGHGVKATGSLDPATYVPRTLQEVLDRRGRLPVRECVALATALASALKHLHDHGLVHRDVKPSNVIFVHGVPKLADIGLVATVGDSRSIVGTEGYLPPEGPGSPPADLYALGKLLYEASTGLNRKAYPQLPPGLRDLPDFASLLEFNEVLLRACARETARRYARADDLLADLALLERGESVRRLRRLERHHVLFKRVALGAALAGLLLSVAWWQNWRGRRIAQRHLAQLHVEKGTEAMVRGDYRAALPWLVGGLSLDRGDARLERVHRVRLASVLDRCAMPAGVFGVGESRVLGADLSADGSRLVTGHEDGTVWLWDTASGDRRRHASLGYPVVHCRFLPPGRRLLTTSLDQKARLWDLASPEKEPIILDQARGVESAVYSVGLNGLRGIAYLSKGLHRFARTNAFEGPFEHVTLRLELIGQPDTVLARYQVRRTGLDGEVLAAGDFADTTAADPLVEGLDTPAAPIWGQVWLMLEDQSIGDAEGGESRMAWDNVRVRLYPTGQPTTSWRVLDDFSSGKLRGWLHESPPAIGHRSQVENGELIMTGHRLPTGQRRGLGAAWMEPFELVPGQTIEIEADLVTAQAPHPVAGLTVFRPELSPFEGAQGNPALHRNRLAYTWWDGQVRIWDLDNDRPVTLSSNGGLAPLTLAHDFGLLTLEFSPDGRYLVSVDWAKRCSVWDLATGKRVGLYTNAPGRVNDARFSPDGRFLALSHDRGLALVERDDWRLDHRLEQRADCDQPRFSPLGDRLAAVRDRHEVVVWDLGDLEATPQVSRHAFPVQRLEFSPDGRWLAIGRGDNRVRLWDMVRGGALGSPLPGTLGRFSADGETLLLAGDESGIWLWDLTGLGDETLTLPPPVAAHESWSASPDGAITAEIHGQRISLKTRRGSHSLVHPAPLRRALFSADGQHLAAEHNDSSAWVWDLETQTLAMPPRPTRYDAALESLPGIELRTENRDLQFLVDLAALLGGQRFDGKGGQQPVDDAAQASLYGELRQARPQDFQRSVVQRQQWHQQEAIRAEQVMEWDRAVFHWERLKPPGPRLDYARTVAERQRAVIEEGGSRWSLRLPRPPWATPGMLDLSGVDVQGVEAPAPEELPHDLFRELVGGVRLLGGVEYDVRDIIDLRRVDRVSIPVNRRCRRIHFLHASVAEARGNREPAAWYRVRYAGGATREVRLLNPEDVRPIESNPFHAFSAGRPSGTAPGWRSITAWVGSDPRLERKGEILHVTGSSWVLPEEPQAEMVTVLELERASKEAASMAPLVFAITVE